RGGLGRAVFGWQRQDEQLFELPDRALRGRIEQADRLDVVAEELEPRRTRLARREDVDDPAAQAPLPDGHDRLDLFVAAACAPRTPHDSTAARSVPPASRRR